ncbi:Histone deacetylase [Paenibacillus curdlanolyticus YK9]|uniref:Acetoin utilization protein AcuC n=1 Tax=Paenibacillus curdlanolyticus YK9 TaxID=717606 RepID=E0I3P7_9BACL|nr:acetoin utilization protein AcuC [Paenibacillus curdlanolyticus]EFM12911.1 Histone deacetylase [Paenibacillus curdlanolyticus YK9]
MPTANAVFIHHPDSERYRFNEHHPFDPTRLITTTDLLIRSDALQGTDIIVPTPADDELILSIHRPDYVQAVKELSEATPSEASVAAAAKYGFTTDDTPYFEGMHQASAAIVGGSVHAAETVMSGLATRAFHMAGGLHHAFPDRGTGFCIYNDAAIAIEHIRSKYGSRILYIDTDVHHGDGVQWTFYSNEHVFTYSIHETGKFLFPGTGFVHERGVDAGIGACMNVPLEPYTEDESWLECFQATVEEAARMFQPDLIVSQHGCDAHAYDPLSHMHCSMRIYHEMPAIIKSLADRYTGGKWVALGGGGYDIWKVVPRAWSLVWMTMIGHPLTHHESGPSSPIAEDWKEAWAERAGGIDQLPAHWHDDMVKWEPMPRRSQIEESNRLTQARVLQRI